jgi:hypothetical protein
LTNKNKDQSVNRASNFQHSTDPSCHIGSRRALSEAEGQPFAGLHFDFAQCPIGFSQGSIDFAKAQSIVGVNEKSRRQALNAQSQFTIHIQIRF